MLLRGGAVEPARPPPTTHPISCAGWSDLVGYRVLYTLIGLVALHVLVACGEQEQVAAPEATSIEDVVAKVMDAETDRAAAALASLSQKQLDEFVGKLRLALREKDSSNFYGSTSRAYGDSWIRIQISLIDLLPDDFATAVDDDLKSKLSEIRVVDEKWAAELLATARSVTRIPPVVLPLGGEAHATFGCEFPFQFDWEGAKPTSMLFFRGFRCKVSAPPSLPGSIGIAGYWSELDHLSAYPAEAAPGRHLHTLHSGIVNFAGNPEFSGASATLLAGSRQPWLGALEAISPTAERRIRLAIFRVDALEQEQLPPPPPDEQVGVQDEEDGR